MATQEAFLKVSEDLHCPLCGLVLDRAKWDNANAKVRTKNCANGHILDILDLDFRVVSMSTCKCGESMPTRDMREVDKQRLCPKCYQIARAAWRMDKDKSYARLEITPIKTTEKHYYQIHTSIKIEPYPNPFMYGGMWGSGSAKDEQELEQAIKHFEETVAGLKENGMERVEVVRHNELMRVEQFGLEGKTTNKPVAPVRTATPAVSRSAAKPSQPAFF